ncbi:hypothetical protein BJ944DRAFT_239544 [Cunninghamella echinulata]|nr:hypothetical protein BJ944DRAFT_243592 [Cunninghamella echinulata]KAI9305567.1 hypothetical protein BJ944DRAFT_239544 [Cunninghamella echinulata]
MIQTTLFNYIHSNNKSIKQAKHKLIKQKQTILLDYFPLKPKKKTILDYFKHRKEKEQTEEKEKVFELVFVDIGGTAEGYYCHETATTMTTQKKGLNCIKRNIYDKDLKYIAISYRWGELNEQLVKTPEYTAHVTSFAKDDFEILVDFIKKEPDLKEIRYVWIDAISIDQQHHNRKKETILQMSEIYQKATYILAIPDLHLKYLYNNPANDDALRSILLNSKTIYESILNGVDDISMHDNKSRKKAYEFLAYLVADWSNRAWVISEYQIAKEKKGTPLKYTFMSLLLGLINYKDVTFFSYDFDHNHHHCSTLEKSNSNGSIPYRKVDSSSKLIQFLKERFTQRLYLDILLNSKASRNEDRFNAILPSWKKYNHLIKNKNTISEWNITNMTSVRLKLYEIMDDVWDKARLLYACSNYHHKLIISPSYASQYDGNYLGLIEKDNDEFAFERYLVILSNYVLETDGKREYIDYIKSNKTEFGPLFTENLIDIRLNHHHSHRQNHHDGYINVPPLYGSGIYLLGDGNQNKWMLTPRKLFLLSFDYFHVGLCNDRMGHELK